MQRLVRQLRALPLHRVEDGAAQRLRLDVALVEVVLDAGLHRVDREAAVLHPGQDDDRRVRRERADRLHRVEPVGARQQQVEQDAAVAAAVLKRLDRVAERGGAFGCEVASEHPLDQLSVALVVLDDEDRYGVRPWAHVSSVRPSSQVCRKRSRLSTDVLVRTSRRANGSLPRVLAVVLLRGAGRARPAGGRARARLRLGVRGLGAGRRLRPRPPERRHRARRPRLGPVPDPRPQPGDDGDDRGDARRDVGRPLPPRARRLGAAGERGLARRRLLAARLAHARVRRDRPRRARARGAAAATRAASSSSRSRTGRGSASR